VPLHVAADAEDERWLWLSPPALDFGGRSPAGAGEERTVWLCADPGRVLGVASGAGSSDARRAFRRAAPQHHPDTNPEDPAALERFQRLQRALDAIVGRPDVVVEPTAGTWWRCTGFDEAPDEPPPAHAVAGLRFELRELHRVPLREADVSLRVSYAGEALELPVRYSAARRARPVRRARVAVAAEAAALVALCVLLVPVLALLLAVDLYVLSGTSVPLALGGAVAIIALGYGALAFALAELGRPLPHGRLIRRSRRAVGGVRALGRSGRAG
jgi:hypothetical protein